MCLHIRNEISSSVSLLGGGGHADTMFIFSSFLCVIIHPSCIHFSSMFQKLHINIKIDIHVQLQSLIAADYRRVFPFIWKLAQGLDWWSSAKRKDIVLWIGPSHLTWDPVKLLDKYQCQYANQIYFKFCQFLLRPNSCWVVSTGLFFY